MPVENRSAQVAAIQKRLKELLCQQRFLWCRYLDALAKQQNAIRAGSEAEIIAYVEIEEGIVADIFSVQKVVASLEEESSSRTAEIAVLKAELENLKSQALAESKCNRDMLSSRMAKIRSEITIVKSNLLAIGGRRSLYETIGTASLVDVTG